MISTLPMPFAASTRWSGIGQHEPRVSMACGCPGYLQKKTIKSTCPTSSGSAVAVLRTGGSPLHPRKVAVLLVRLHMRPVDIRSVTSCDAGFHKPGTEKAAHSAAPNDTNSHAAPLPTPSGRGTIRWRSGRSFELVRLACAHDLHKRQIHSRVDKALENVPRFVRRAGDDREFRSISSVTRSVRSRCRSDSPGA